MADIICYFKNLALEPGFYCYLYLNRIKWLGRYLCSLSGGSKLGEIFWDSSGGKSKAQKRIPSEELGVWEQLYANVKYHCANFARSDIPHCSFLLWNYSVMSYVKIFQCGWIHRKTSTHPAIYPTLHIQYIPSTKKIVEDGRMQLCGIIVERTRIGYLCSIV